MLIRTNFITCLTLQIIMIMPESLVGVELLGKNINILKVLMPSYLHRLESQSYIMGPSNISRVAMIH